MQQIQEIKERITKLEDQAVTFQGNLERSNCPKDKNMSMMSETAEKLLSSLEHQKERLDKVSD